MIRDYYNSGFVFHYKRPLFYFIAGTNSTETFSLFQAALSILNPQRIMVLGQSKDFGVCKSTRKDGERCTAFINLCNGEHCIYHIQKEYKKSSLRQNLQASASGHIALRNKILGKNEVFYAGKSYTAIPAKKNKKQAHKDEHLLKSLSGHGETEVPAVRNERNVRKDEQLLKSLSENKQPAVSTDSHSKPQHPLAMGFPVLSGFRKQNVDLNAPASKRQIDHAKLNALKWVQRNGAIQKRNPNSSTKSAGKKRPREPAEVAELNSKIQKVEESGFFSDRFKKMMAATSSNSHLLEVHEDEQAQKYFDKLEMREKMEQNMIGTYKVVCKAVRCLKCKYTSFSASDRCKAEKHPLRVFDAMKRFFKCGNCGNRTVCLEIVPVVACKNCGGGKWERTGMMKERIEKPNNHLSIRGGEQTFVNSVVSNGNLDLLLPED